MGAVLAAPARLHIVAIKKRFADFVRLDYWFFMSTAEILNELPKLTPSERQAVARRLFELDPAKDELEACARAADLAFQQLDKLEADDARSASR